MVKAIALLLQLGGLVGLAVYLGVFGDLEEDLSASLYIRPIIAFLIALIALSLIWSDKMQIWIASTSNVVDHSTTARYKSSKKHSLCVWLYSIMILVAHRLV